MHHYYNHQDQQQPDEDGDVTMGGVATTTTTTTTATATKNDSKDATNNEDKDGDYKMGSTNSQPGCPFYNSLSEQQKQLLQERLQIAKANLAKQGVSHSDLRFARPDEINRHGLIKPSTNTIVSCFKDPEKQRNCYLRGLNEFKEKRDDPSAYSFIAAKNTSSFAPFAKMHVTRMDGACDKYDASTAGGDGGVPVYATLEKGYGSGVQCISMLNPYDNYTNASKKYDELVMVSMEPCNPNHPRAVAAGEMRGPDYISYMSYHIDSTPNVDELESIRSYYDELHGTSVCYNAELLLLIGTPDDESHLPPMVSCGPRFATAPTGDKYQPDGEGLHIFVEGGPTGTIHIAPRHPVTNNNVLRTDEELATLIQESFHLKSRLGRLEQARMRRIHDNYEDFEDCNDSCTLLKAVGDVARRAEYKKCVDWVKNWNALVCKGGMGETGTRTAGGKDLNQEEWREYCEDRGSTPKGRREDNIEYYKQLLIEIDPRKYRNIKDDEVLAAYSAYLVSVGGTPEGRMEDNIPYYKALLIKKDAKKYGGIQDENVVAAYLAYARKGGQIGGKARPKNKKTGIKPDRHPVARDGLYYVDNEQNYWVCIRYPKVFDWERCLESGRGMRSKRRGELFVAMQRDYEVGEEQAIYWNLSVRAEEERIATVAAAKKTKKGNGRMCRFGCGRACTGTGAACRSKKCESNFEKEERYYHEYVQRRGF